MGLPLNQIAMVGDSMEQDVLAPRNFGLQSVWFNSAGGRHEAQTMVPTVTQELEQFARLVRNALDRQRQPPFHERSFISDGLEMSGWPTCQAHGALFDHGDRRRVSAIAPPRKPPTMSLSLLLRCRDLDETRRFYRTVLGFEVADSPGPTLTARLQGGTLIFTAQDL